MLWKEVKGGTSHEGQKFEKTREVGFPETLQEVTENFSEEQIVSYFNVELRRKVAEELRQEIRVEQGITSLSAGEKQAINALIPMLDILGIDHSEFSRLPEYQEALTQAIS